MIVSRDARENSARRFMKRSCCHSPMDYKLMASTSLSSLNASRLACYNASMGLGQRDDTVKL